MNSLLTTDAERIFEDHYLKRDQLARVIETPQTLFRRVTQAVAAAERKWSSLDEVDYYQQEYFQMMRHLEFLPSPLILKNAGKEHGILLAGVVLPLQDSIEDITHTLKTMRLLNQSEVQVGIDFSNLRPQGDRVESTGEEAGGPLTFMEMFSQTIASQPESVGLNSILLRIDHDEIVNLLESPKFLKNLPMKLVIGITSHFMRCVKKKTTYPLINPRHGKITRFVSANKIFDHLCRYIQEYGNPKIIFLDEVNRQNPTPQLGKLEAASHAGTQPLLPYEGCALGAINLAAFINEKRELDEERFEIVVDLAVRFLDNIFEVTHYPLPEMKTMSQATRKIGLGVVGLAEFLYKLQMPYSSPKAKSYLTTLLKLLLKRARQASMALAQQRGPFAKFTGSIFEKSKFGPLRNATLTAVPLHEELAHLANVSSGIEPISKKLKPMELLAMQASFQKYTDNGVELKVPLYPRASVKEVERILLKAYELKCKGVIIDSSNI